ncbi:beta-1,3-galactosyltransferase 5-like [Saccostrea echinata]|uniref:beta-1,3-galactosyltransferase 5-like n=1 Tax=Saccostrea echinata TaxID=191078 RepID=UPI002A83DC8F|nr:beta-1,3-galactosyltransferase 5-like [Saccostrea echinata]
MKYKTITKHSSRNSVTSCFTRRLQIPIWKLFLYFAITTVLVFMLQMHHSQISPEVTTPSPTTTKTTPKPTMKTTETDFLKFYNKSSYNNSHFLTHPYDIDFVRFVSKVEEGKSFNLKPINVNSFVYVTNPTTKCTNPPLKRSANVSVLILIKSEPDNFHLRQTIRWNWESLKQYHEYMRIVFLMGISSNPEDKNTDVLVEHARYNDIVQQNFIDKYRNLTHKTVMGYMWAVQYCSEASHILIQDDDYHFNVKNLDSFIKKHKDPNSIFAGILRLKSPTVRRPASKYFVAKEVYAHEIYPPFLVGNSYIVSMHFAKKIVTIIPFVKSIPMADTYIGVLAMKLDITLNNEASFTIKNCNSLDKVISCRGYTSTDEILKDWKNFVNRAILKVNI